MTTGASRVGLPRQVAGARPGPGLRCGRQANIANILARIFQRASQETDDVDFAHALTAVALAEGGLRGAGGDPGPGGPQSWGPFQFFWGGGMGNTFQQWLSEREARDVPTNEAQLSALDVDLALDFYISRAVGFYRRGQARDLPNVLAIVGGGHNTNALNVPRLRADYEKAWRAWNAGEFEGGNSVPAGPPRVEELEQENPHLRQQAADWQAARRQVGQDPFEWPAFRAHLIALRAPDPGPVAYDGFTRMDGDEEPPRRPIEEAEQENPHLRSQLAAWQAARRDLEQDPFDYPSFRAHVVALGAPDPGPLELTGFRG